MKVYIGFWSKPMLAIVDKLKQQGRDDEVDSYIQSIRSSLVIHSSILGHGLEQVFLTDTAGEKFISECNHVSLSVVEKIFDDIAHISPAFDGYEKFFAIPLLTQRGENFVYLDYLYHIPQLHLSHDIKSLVVETCLVEDSGVEGLSVPVDRSRGFFAHKVETFNFAKFLSQFNSSYHDKEKKTLFDFSVPDTKETHKYYLSDIIIPNDYSDALSEIAQSVTSSIDRIQQYIAHEDVLENLHFVFKNSRYFVDNIFTYHLSSAIEKGAIDVSYYLENSLSNYPELQRAPKGHILPIDYFRALGNVFKFNPSKVTDWKRNLNMTKDKVAVIESARAPSAASAGPSVSTLRDEARQPSLAKMAGNFATAMKDFAKSGFLRATEEQHRARMDICNTCEFWQGDARLGMGKCLKCGCTGAKQWIAASVCPINKWGAISREEVEGEQKGESESN